MFIATAFALRLRAEIDEHFPDGQDPTDSAVLAGMVYLNAVMYAFVLPMNLCGYLTPTS